MIYSFEDISHHYGVTPSVDDISFAIKQGEVVSLLGPSGCGKSTLLRLAAGLEAPHKGQIRAGNKIISSAGYALPADQRHMGLVFQNYALFPHLTILENVCYGLKMPKKQAQERAHHVMHDVGVDKLANMYPHECSGGQQQRVALARAIAPSPQLLLLDEPFSGLDTRLRERIRDTLLHLLREQNIATLMVTHDAEEAMFMSDRIVVMNQGQIVQIGRPIDVYRSPVNAFVATFFGEANRFDGQVQAGQVQTILGAIDTPQLSDGQAVEVVVRNENLNVYTEPQHQADKPFSLVELHLLGGSTLIHLAGDGDDGTKHHFHAKIPGINFLQPEMPIYLAADQSQIFIYPKT